MGVADLSPARFLMGAGKSMPPYEFVGSTLTNNSILPDWRDSVGICRRPVFLLRVSSIFQ